MADERRSDRRAHLSGVRVAYESASGGSVDADVLDLSRGGLFIRTASPLAVGKRIAVEITVIGEPAPWAAIGRVVWTRTKGEGDHAPPGMGVKLIDADDAVLDAITRMVGARERTDPGVGKPSSPPPAVAPAPTPAVGLAAAIEPERTLALGVAPAMPPDAAPPPPVTPRMPPAAPPAPGLAPVVASAPERERTLMGVGLAEGDAAPPARAAGALGVQVPPPREQSIAIDLVARS